MLIKTHCVVNYIQLIHEDKTTAILEKDWGMALGKTGLAS